jgi:hypothetical protein
VQRDRKGLSGASYVTPVCKFVGALRGSSRKRAARQLGANPNPGELFMANRGAQAGQGSMRHCEE